MKTSLLSKLTPFLTIAALLSIPATLSATEYETSGGATYVVTDSESTMLPNGANAVRMTSKTILVADDESVPFHLASQTATGTNVFDADGNLIAGVGYAHAVDKDGDVMYIWWESTKTGSKWGFISGTGKYQGMEGGGTSDLVHVNANGSQVIRWHGKWIQK